MKKNFLLMLVVLGTALSAAATAKPLPITKKIGIEGSYKKIIISGAVKVVLVDNTADSFVIEGQEKNVQRISVAVSNGKLMIKTPAGNMKDRAVVYVPVSMINSVEVDGDIDVNSNVVLNTPLLLLSMNGESHARLRTTGQVKVDTAGDYEIRYIIKAIQ
jgi:hypothetical protein